MSSNGFLCNQRYCIMIQYVAYMMLLQTSSVYLKSSVRITYASGDPSLLDNLVYTFTEYESRHNWTQALQTPGMNFFYLILAYHLSGQGLFTWTAYSYVAFILVFTSRQFLSAPVDEF